MEPQSTNEILKGIAKDLPEDTWGLWAFPHEYLAGAFAGNSEAVRCEIDKELAPEASTKWSDAFREMNFTPSDWRH